MNEKIFFSTDGLIVTNKKISTNGDIYFISKISSCKIRNTIEIDSDIKYSQNIFIVLGIIAIFISIAIIGKEDINLFLRFSGIIIGLILMIFALNKFEPNYNLYYVIIGTLAGDIIIATSKDYNVCQELVNTINDAISYNNN